MQLLLQRNLIFSAAALALMRPLLRGLLGTGAVLTWPLTPVVLLALAFPAAPGAWAMHAAAPAAMPMAVLLDSLAAPHAAPATALDPVLTRALLALWLTGLLASAAAFLASAAHDLVQPD